MTAMIFLGILGGSRLAPPDPVAIWAMLIVPAGFLMLREAYRLGLAHRRKAMAGLPG